MKAITVEPKTPGTRTVEVDEPIIQLASLFIGGHPSPRYFIL